MRRPIALPLNRGLAVAFLTGAFIAAGLSAAEARRLALVVGNASYTTAPTLKNPVKDAQAVAAALERLGFEVTLLTDVPIADFWPKVDSFAVEAQSAEATVFYYAGHAFQMQGQNYLLPIDASLASRDTLRSETWNLDGIIARLQDRKRQTLIFLDACRNDPLPAAVRGSGAADGLARLQTGVGTFVAFATEPGAVTYDGAGDAQNSPFATSLLKNLETEGQSISDLMIKVRNEVAEVTGGRQTPWDQSSLRDQFYFKAATETKQELTEADYELLAQLSPEDRAQFLELLKASGFSEESLKAADDAITVASYNLEVAAESEVSIGAAPVGAVAVAEAPAEIDIASLEVVEDSSQTVGTIAETPAPETPAPEAPAPETTEVASLEPTPEVPTPPTEPVAEAPATPEPTTEVAEAPAAPEPTTEVAEAPAAPEPTTEVAEAPAEPEPTTEVAEAPAEPEPTTEVAEAPAAPEPTTEVAEAPAAPEPTTEVAEAPAAPEPTTEVAEAPAAPEPTTEVAEAPATPEPTTEVAEAPATPEPTTEVAEAPATPEPTTEVAEAPAELEPTTEVAALEPEPMPPVADLPQPESTETPLGQDAADAGPPVRLAALTWQTRGILGLGAINSDRDRIPASEITPDSDENRAILAAIDPTLLDESTATIDEGDLARAAQSELARLGCYRMTVDGSWGKGSRTALTSYFLAKKTVPDSLEPSAELVARLKAESKVVCEVRVARAKVVAGKTKPILPQRAAATEAELPKNYKPKAGNKAVTKTERKKEIKKGLLNAGSF